MTEQIPLLDKLKVLLECDNCKRMFWLDTFYAAIEKLAELGVFNDGQLLCEDCRKAK